MNLQYQKQAGIGQAERQVIDTMIHYGKPAIRAIDLEQEFGHSHKNANLILSRLCRKGWLQRLQPGIYRVVPLGSDSPNPLPEDPWAIGVTLFDPCYISGWTAAEHWELTEQIFNTMLIFTTQKQRKKEHLISGVQYRTKKISSEAIFGVTKIWSKNVPILIADPHKTVIDILDEPAMGGGGRHTIDIVKAYWAKPEADPHILWQYAEKLDHGAVFKRLGFISESLFHLPFDLLDSLKKKIKTGIIKWDPNGPDSGPIISKWGIRLNIPMEDIL